MNISLPSLSRAVAALLRVTGFHHVESQNRPGFTAVTGYNSNSRKLLRSSNLSVVDFSTIVELEALG